MSDVPSTLERIVRRDRLVVVVAVTAIAGLAWWYLVRTTAAMTSMAADVSLHAAMGMGDMRLWGASDWVSLVVMWAVMMVAMMLPSAAPTILLVLATYRRRADRGARVSAATFVAGYVLVWTAFSALAAGAQVALHRAALLSATMTSQSSRLAGVILLVAGVYQWLPMKKACLGHCQSPIDFLGAHWREGVAGALTMGLQHGAFCVGCCWALMTLLFVVGVMNLLWVAAIAVFVLIEKVMAAGVVVERVSGALLVLWGLWVLR